MSDPNNPYIYFIEHKKADQSVLLEIKLNNAKKLNVLNSEIIFALHKNILKWRDKEELSAVFIHSEGDRAFCAGGDVVQVYSTILESKKRGEKPALAAKPFFQTEYETDYLMHQFPKPIVLWGNGIVMGGGMGLFMASSHPIVTETSLLAMPEISIGFFSDVGASYFLNQINKDIGRYLALTACHLNASEACYLDLANWAFSNEDKQKVFDFLAQSSFKDEKEFNSKFKEFYKKPHFLLEQDNWIKRFEKEILKSLECKDLKSFYDFLSKQALEDKKWEKNRQNFLKASPTSLAVISEQLQRAQGQKNLKALLEMELTIAMRKMEGFDFLKEFELAY